MQDKIVGRAQRNSCIQVLGNVCFGGRISVSVFLKFFLGLKQEGIQMTEVLLNAGRTGFVDKLT